MARRGALGGGGLNPFGGAGVSFGAFDIVGTNRESELILTRVEIAWNAGQASDQQYLDALKAYAQTLESDTSARLNAEARVDNVAYTVERQVLTARVDAGTATIPDLLAYDKSKLTGLNQDSQEYRQRQNTYQGTQSRYYSDLESEVVNSYNNGKMTTAQLANWYQARKIDDNLAGNPDITKAIDQRLEDLTTRLTSEADSKVLSDYSAGKVSPASFITYATAARARYVPGSNDYKDWSTRITDAQERSLETGLLYRYDLSQKYAQLAKFVASSSAPAGGTSTSTSTRTVLGADGGWHTVKSTTTKPTAPSPSEQKAYAQRQIEVADAKRQMKELTTKASGVGGFVSTDTVINYYVKQRDKFAKGSDEWYGIQGKLDSLNDNKHQEQVLASEGIRISYPGVSSGGTTGSTGGGGGGGGAGTSSRVATTAARSTVSDTAGITVEQFMAAEASVESGGRYTARNKSSGAYGKYQIMPANWPAWAGKYLGNSSAPQTPENQEKVARGKFLDLYKWLGDWRAVAHWWLTGNGSKDPGTWSASSTHYVNMVFANLGKGPVSGSSLAANAGATGASGSSGGAVKAPTSAVSGGGAAAKPKTATSPAGELTSTFNTITGGKGPLQVIAGENQTTSMSASTQGRAPSMLTTTHLTLTRANFPTGLDSAAFTKFYSQYSAAFQSGASEFSVNTGNGTVHYFIGDDPTQRRDGMRALDAMRINLFKVQMNEPEGYASTSSEINAAAKFDQAVEDAGRHELMILDMRLKPGAVADKSVTPEKAVNPIYLGLDAIDRTVAAIGEHMKLADAALKRGDLTTAYYQNQLALGLRTNANDLLSRFGAAGANDISAIEQAYGVQADEALGTDKAATLRKDLGRLTNYGTELDAAVNASAETRQTLTDIVRKDSSGNPMFDSPLADGQLQLDDGYHWELQPNGELKPEMSPAAGYDVTTGSQRHDIKGMAHIDYVQGSNNVTEVYAKYDIGPVGYINVPGQPPVEILGKVLTRRNPVTHKDEMWVENPFKPGAWSSSMIVYNPGSGFKSVAGENNTVVFEFTGMRPTGTQPGGRGQGSTPTPDGWTYKLIFDKDTGTYTAYRSKPGGLSADIIDQPMGSLVPGSEAALAFEAAGFARDRTGLTADQMALSDLSSPWIGGSAAQRQLWLNSMQTPVLTQLAATRASYPASVRDYQSLAKPELAPPGPPPSVVPASARDYQSLARPELGPPTTVPVPLTARTDGRAPSAAARLVPLAPLPLPKPLIDMSQAGVMATAASQRQAAAMAVTPANAAVIAAAEAKRKADAEARRKADAAAAEKSRRARVTVGMTGTVTPTHPGGGGAQEY